MITLDSHSLSLNPVYQLQSGGISTYTSAGVLSVAGLFQPSSCTDVGVCEGGSLAELVLDNALKGYSVPAVPV